jgi:hypothetical protein
MIMPKATASRLRSIAAVAAILLVGHTDPAFAQYTLAIAPLGDGKPHEIMATDLGMRWTRSVLGMLPGGVAPSSPTPPRTPQTT